jgi:DHA3 family macrolide efflux protein-like MFS transporter
MTMEQSEAVEEEGAMSGRWARRFFRLWTGQAFSLIGSALVQWALMFWLAVTTGSPRVLAIAGVMGLLPQVLLAPFAGVYVDRLDRKRVMLFADLLTAASTAFLMVLFAMGYSDLWYVFVVMFFRSSMQAFHWPAMQASTTLMVPEQNLARINGLNQMIIGLSSILGPALGAVLYIALPMYLVLAVDVLTAGVAIVVLLAIKIPEIRKETAHPKASILRDLAESFRYLRSWKGALLIISMFSVVNFLITPAITFFNLLTLYHFGQGPYEAALIDAIAGIGMIVGGIALGIWGGTKRKIVTGMGAMTIAGGGVLFIGILPPSGYLLAVAATSLVGIAIAIVNGVVMAILQRGVRADVQGRVFAIVGSIASAMSPLGLAVSGPIAAAFGVQAWFISGGMFMIAVGVAAFFFPAVMRVEDQIAEPIVVAGQEYA